MQFGEKCCIIQLVYLFIQTCGDILARRKLGDRKEGRYLRKLDPYNAITPYIMKTRTDSSNYFTDKIEVTEAWNYLRRKRAEGLTRLGFLHLFVAAYVRTISQCPALNRFVSGQRIYARNDIEFVMTVKKEMSADAGETSIKVVFDPHDTINEVYEKIEAEIDNVKNGAEDNGTDKVAAALMRAPRLLLRFTVALLNFLDYFGLLPKALLDVSPFHGSMILTNMASLGIPPIYHHLYNFGNLPVFISFGKRYTEYDMTKTGEYKQKTYIDFAVVTDERICDGFYYARSFKYIKSYILDPSALDEPPENVVTDPAL